MNFESAARRFRAFFDREPGPKEIVHVREPGKIALVIGSLDGIIYSTSDGQRYEHRFKKSDRPLLLVSFDGRQIYALKGAYRFTERGFIK